MEYEVIESEYLDSLQVSISARLNDGWFCVGGISIAVYTYKDPTDYDSEKPQMTYAQAVVKGNSIDHEKVISFMAHAKDSCNNAMALGIRLGDYIDHNPDIFSKYRK